MSDSFDPYHIWLGISPKDQPPNHYRLLGIDLLESDPNVIESAADRQMSHVRTFQTGRHSALSQEVLNEIAAAKVTLLNPEKKAQYDEHLRAELDQPRAQPPPKAPAIPQPPPRLEKAGREEPGGSDFDGVQAAGLEAPPIARLRQQRRPVWQNPIVLGSLCAGVIVLVPLLYVLNSGGDARVADQEPQRPGPAGNNGHISPETPTPPPERPTPPPERPTPPPNESTSPPDKPTSPPDKPTAPPDKPTAPPDEPSPPPSKTAAGEPMNLLKLIDPERDAVKGQWRFEEQTLVGPMGRHNRLRVAYKCPEEYILTIVAARKSGNDTLAVGLPVAGFPNMLILDGWSGTRSGLDIVDGRKAENNQTTWLGQVFREQKPSTIVCAVRKTRVVVNCNGKTIIDWLGDPHRLSLGEEWECGSPLFVGTHYASFDISRLELTPLSEAAGARPEPATPGASQSEPADKRLPLPKVADPQWPTSGRRVEQRLRETFPKEYAEAKKPEGKLPLARLLLRQAGKTNNDPTARYMMLTQARDLATEGGAAAVAMDAVERLVAEYEVEAWPLRAETLSQLGRMVRLPEGRAAVARAAMDLVEPALQEDRYEVAQQMADLAVAMATRTRDVELRKQAHQLQKQVRSAAGTWKQLQSALATLKARPDDLDANLAVGTHFCFVKGDWPRGLPHLAKGSDETLKALAAKELKGAALPNEQVTLGDQWWELAQRRKDAERDALLAHAGFWYAKAKDELAPGLSREKVLKRLAEAEQRLTAEKDRGAEPQKDPTRKRKWVIIFRSSDPTRWNTDFSQGEEYAVPLRTAPDDLRFLRIGLSANPRAKLIIPMTKQRLGMKFEQGRIGWNGTGKKEWGSYRLGAYLLSWETGKKGTVHIRNKALGRGFTGWGFGNVHFVEEVPQGYCWQGQAIPRAIFEIAVTAEPLTKEEQSFFPKP